MDFTSDETVVDLILFMEWLDEGSAHRTPRATFNVPEDVSLEDLTKQYCAERLASS